MGFRSFPTRISRVDGFTSRACSSPEVYNALKRPDRAPCAPRVVSTKCHVNTPTTVSVPIQSAIRRLNASDDA